MTNWIISSSILIIIVLLLRQILKGRISLRIQYAVWLLVAVRLLVPINLGSTFLSIENYTDQIKHYHLKEEMSETVLPEPALDNEYKVKIYDNVIPNAANTSENNQEYSSVAAEKNINILTVIWIVGIVAVGSIFVISNVVFNRRINSSRRKITIHDCKLPVYISDKIATPCLYHVFHPAIYLTENVAKDEKVISHTISHELAHYHQGDLYWNIIRCVCLTVHWYNPLVWLASIISRRDCELACDEAAIKELGEQDRLEYGKTLIQLTCQKPSELFLISTTMTTGKQGLKERIRLIAKKPRTTIMGCFILVTILLVAAGCTFTGANDEETGNNAEFLTIKEYNETYSSKIPETQESVQPVESAEVETKFYNEPEKNKVCLAVMPDGISKAGGDYRYIIPEDQIKWTDYYKQARSLTIDGAWKDGERSVGIWVVFNDEWTCITEQGMIFDFEKRAEKEQIEAFYNLCMEEAIKYGTGTPLRSENVREIRSATLEYNGTYTVTDDTILTTIEKQLVSSPELRGGAACPFTASLTLEFINDRTETIYIATDSCTVWLTDGVYHEYSVCKDIEEVYNIFKEYSKKSESNQPEVNLAGNTSNVTQIIKQAEERLRDNYREAKLTYVDNAEVGWDYYSDNPWSTEEERDALAQAALKELYTLTGFNVEECTYTTDGRSRFIFGKSAEYIRKSIAFYSRDYGFTLCGDSTPYMGFVNARRVHYSDVQQLDSPYGKAEFSGHAAIPAWFLEHSGVYQGEKIIGYDTFNLDDTVFTHVKLFFDGGYYIVVMDEGIESVHNIMGPYPYAPMLNVNGTVYYGTDEIGPMGDSGAVGGYIEKSVSKYTIPDYHGQSNFGCIGNPYTFDDGSGIIQVLMEDGEYHIFYHEDLWIY